MTLRELIQGIKANTIEVDFSKGWVDLNNPKAFLIETLEEQLGMFEIKTDEEKSFFKKIFEKRPKHIDEIEILENGALTFGLLNYLKIHSFILSTELYICLTDNKIKFKKFDHSKEYPVGKRPMIEPSYEEGIEKPLITSISVPSKKLIITNFFPKNISPDIEDRYSSKNSLNGLIGRRNHARHYEKHGVLYGQTANTGLTIWVNETNTEIIITECHFDEVYGADEDDFDTKEEWEEYVNDNKEKLIFCNWLKENNFETKYGDKISCSVWRFEATDYEKGKEIIDLKENKVNNWNYRDIVVVPIAGDSVVMEHYFDSIEKSPISKFIVSKITVK
jgi:hypothetical protein